MIRISELKLPLERLYANPKLESTWTRDAQNLNTSQWLTAQTDTDTSPKLASSFIDPNAPEALQQLLFQTLAITKDDVAQLKVFKRSFDARKTPLQVVYIVDMRLHDAALEHLLLGQKFPVVLSSPHI